MSRPRLFPGILLGLALGAASVPAAAAEAWEARVHPRVLERSAVGTAEYLVFLRAQTDLKPGSLPATRTERGRAVFERLRKTAADTQGPLLERLADRGVEHRSFWIANMIWVRSGRETLRGLALDPAVLRIDANPRVRGRRPVVEPDRPSTGRGPGAPEWNVSLIGADQLWALGYTGEGAVIGGQDTGYEWDHPAIRDRYRGWNGQGAVHDYHWHDAVHSGGGSCGADATAPCDDHNHGTHTMGTMVGDDGATNRTGVAPGARWIGCRNMDQGNGTPASYSECFQWFVAPTDLNGENPDPAAAPHVISNSWTCTDEEGCSFDTLRTVVENTRAAGIVVVASAGNGGGGGCSTIALPPAIYDATFSVGATDSLDQIAGFSSRGPVTADLSGRLKPDVAAPGVSVRSSIRGAGYASFSGTSMAAPHVAGLVALLLDARPDLAGDVDTIESLLRASTTPLISAEQCGGVLGVPNNTFGHGRVDAVELVLGDADGDGTSNVDDCRALDGSLWGAPDAVKDLTLSGAGQTTLAWSAPSAPGATSVGYEVLRGTWEGGFDSGSCLTTTAGASALDAELPDGLFFYLVRATNPCGATVGSDSSGAPRDSAATCD